jgi:L-amino acid N-acyltransferase YncA
MRVRDAIAEDAGRIAEIHVRAWQSAYRGIMPDGVLDALSVEKRRALWVGELANSTRRTLVVEVDETVVGWLAFGPCRDLDAKSTAEVYGIYLEPEFVGRGLGRLLWSSACEAMAADGHSEFVVWVLVANERARRFYERMGGRSDGSAGKVIELEGIGLPEVRYWCPTST